MYTGPIIDAHMHLWVLANGHSSENAGIDRTRSPDECLSPSIRSINTWLDVSSVGGCRARNRSRGTACWLGSDQPCYTRNSGR